MTTVKSTSKYELNKAEAGSPANGLYNLTRLSDNEISNWFDNETVFDLVLASKEKFDKLCDEIFQ